MKALIFSPSRGRLPPGLGVLKNFTILSLLSAIAFLGPAGAKAKSPVKNKPLGESKAVQTEDTKNPVIVMDTSMGPIEIELWSSKAPATVKNFLKYVEDGFYDGKIFHRTIDGFMIQGGGFNAEMKEGATREPIKNEATPSLKNDRGTIAMARTNAPHSATAQFFINVTDNASLNQRDKSDGGYGYAVFGKVTKGMDVVDKIKSVPTKSVGGHQDVPVKPVLIKTAKRKSS